MMVTVMVTVNIPRLLLLGEYLRGTTFKCSSTSHVRFVSGLPFFACHPSVSVTHNYPVVLPPHTARPQGSSKKKKKRKPVDNKDRGPRKFYWAPDVHILAKQWAALKASGDTTAFDAWIHRQASLVQEYLTVSKTWSHTYSKCHAV